MLVYKIYSHNTTLYSIDQPSEYAYEVVNIKDDAIPHDNYGLFQLHDPEIPIEPLSIKGYTFTHDKVTHVKLPNGDTLDICFYQSDTTLNFILSIERNGILDEDIFYQDFCDTTQIYQKLYNLLSDYTS